MKPTRVHFSALDSEGAHYEGSVEGLTEEQVAAAIRSWGHHPLRVRRGGTSPIGRLWQLLRPTAAPAEGDGSAAMRFAELVLGQADTDHATTIEFRIAHTIEALPFPNGEVFRRSRCTAAELVIDGRPAPSPPPRWGEAVLDSLAKLAADRFGAEAVRITTQGDTKAVRVERPRAR